jgi:hypothetical protein
MQTSDPESRRFNIGNERGMQYRLTTIVVAVICGSARCLTGQQDSNVFIRRDSVDRANNHDS